jgi:Conserved region in glutamate synthase
MARPETEGECPSSHSRRGGQPVSEALRLSGQFAHLGMSSRARGAARVAAQGMDCRNRRIEKGDSRVIKVGASGKVATGIDVVKRIAQGADYTNAARAMMMAAGCIQAQECHSNKCPVGVDPEPPPSQGSRRAGQDRASPSLPAGNCRRSPTADRFDGAPRCCIDGSTTPQPRPMPSCTTG